MNQPHKTISMLAAAAIFAVPILARPASALPKMATHPRPAARVKAFPSHTRRDTCDIYRLIGLHYQSQGATLPWSRSH